MINHDTTGHILWPYDDPENIEYCDCGNVLPDDPCVIDGEKLCDECASKIMSIRANRELSMIDFAYNFFGYKRNGT